MPTRAWQADRMTNTVGGAVILIALLGFGSSCLGEDTGPVPTSSQEDAVAQHQPMISSYRAEWLVDARGARNDSPNFPYAYVEVIDELHGDFRVESPQHIAVQSRDEVVLCAIVLRGEPYCASNPRPQGVPDVFSYPIQLLKLWGPREVFGLASYPEIALASELDTEAWQQNSLATADGLKIECYSIIGMTNAGREGLEICFTQDELRLIASLDVEGDGVYEVELTTYNTNVATSDFVTGLEGLVEAKPAIYEQLLALFPEVPAARPTPTPTPEPEPEQ